MIWPVTHGRAHGVLSSEDGLCGTLTVRKRVTREKRSNQASNRS